MRKTGIALIVGLSLLALGVQAELRILRSSGDVWLEDAEGKRLDASADTALACKVRTGEGAKAVVDIDGDLLMLSENSAVEIRDSSWLEQLTGFIYYSFRSATEGERTRRVSTQTATIGIRGTRFSVASDVDKNATIALEEGVVDVQPKDGEFAVKRPSAATSYKDYREQMRDHVEAEKKRFWQFRKQQQDAFVDYVKNITMAPGTVLRLEGKSAATDPLGEELRGRMEAMRAFAADVLQSPDYEGY